MTDDDKAGFGTRLALLAEALNAPLSAVRLQAYFEALRDLPVEAVHRALNELLASARFFPLPVEIREAVLGRPQEEADLAWGQLLREVRRVGRYRTPTLPAPVLAAIEAVWGSWAGLCESLPAEGAELVGWCKQFKSAYATLARRAQWDTGTALPAGLAMQLLPAQGESLAVAMRRAMKVVR